MELYGNVESGHTFKVRMMLGIAGIAHRYIEVDIFRPHVERAEPFRSLATYGEVPLLVHADQPYVQSNAILCHLAEYSGRFGGESRARMDRAREWLFWEANRIGLSLPHLRYARRFAPQDYPAGTLDWMQQRFEADIARLDAEFATGRPFILDDQPSIADFALSGYAFWPEQAGVSMPQHVQAWLDRLRALPGWSLPQPI